MNHLRRSPLWQQRSFVIFWAGQSVSMLGSRITSVALPLTAILTLHAAPFEIGVLGAMGSAATVLFSLPAGAWLDRVRRRPVMIAANLGRGVLLSSIPVAAWLGMLSLPQLYIVGFLAALLGVFFNVARNAYVPSLVPRKHLVSANSALRVSGSATQVVGPSIGGVLVQLLTAPTAIGLDALSFLFSALTVWLIRYPEPTIRRAESANMRREIAEGLRVVLHNPLLRSLIGGSATFGLFDSMLFAVYVLYMSRTLHLTAATIGLIFGLAGVAGLAGAVLVSPLSQRVGVGRATLYGILIATAGELSIAGAGGPQVVAVVVLVGAEGAVELGAALYGVNVGSVQQAITKDTLRGRVGASVDLLTLGVEPLGAVAGGILGQTLGLRQTVIVAAVGSLLSLLWFLRSPVRELYELPGTP